MALRGIEKLREEGVFKLKKTVPAGRCPVLRCGNPSKPIGSCGLCAKHHQQRWRMRSKKESAYALLKAHAKQRGIDFRISAEYFSGLADALAMFDHTAETRGETPSLDRLDPSLGYVPSNLRVITVSENSKKAARETRLPEHVQAILARKRAQAIKKFEELDRRMNGDPDACPF